MFVNIEGFRILKNLGLELVESKLDCTIANDEQVECIGKIIAPITLKHKTFVFDIIVAPALRHTMVLGSNFWIKMGVVPDLRKGEWYFSKTPLCNSIVNNPTKGLNNHLTAGEQQILEETVDEYFDSIKDIKLGKTTLVHHKIEIPSNVSPIKQKYYRVSYHLQKIIDEEIENMLKLDVIEPSKSEYSSPIMLVQKSDGTYRFVVDFRKVNQVSLKPAYPLPFIHEILDQLGQAKYLTSLDIKSAYWQIPLEENSKQYTAFSIPGKGHFQFKRMPFGLQGAPGTFQALVDKLYGDLKPQVFCYLDDLILISSDFQSHIKLLKTVFHRLKTANLTLKREKCKFCRNELDYLGYKINQQGLNVNPDKVRAIVDMPVPKNVKEVRRIIGMLSWYRRFIKDFSTIISPLSKLTRKNTKFTWTEECTEAFNKIKSILVSKPILACPNFEHPFILNCDASNVGLGCVLTQNYDNKEHVIAYISRGLTKTESKYGATQLECLCVIWAIEKLRCYIEGSKFTVVTDCYSIKWLNSLKDPSGRLGRWCLRLQAFDFEVIHRKGKDNVVADCLSRAIPSDSLKVNSMQINIDNVCSGDSWYDNMLKKVTNNPQKYDNWGVDSNVLYKRVNIAMTGLSKNSDAWKEVVPKNRRSEILYKYHNNVLTGSHLGVYKTYNRILDKYYWPGLKSDVYRFIRKCTTCTSHKPLQKLPAGEMGSRPEITQPFQLISSDLFGPLPMSHGYQYILVISDYFSKFSVFLPLRTATAKNVIKALEEQFFLIYGVPEFIIVDNGVQYSRSSDFNNFLKEYGVTPLFNALYTPHQNPSERVNRVLKTVLSSYVEENHKSWSTKLAHIACALRTAKHETTRHTPYFAVFGKEMVINGREFKDQRHRDQVSGIVNNKVVQDPVITKSEGLKQLHKEISQKLKHAYEKTKMRYDLRRRPVSFKVNDWVWKRDFPQSNAGKNFTAKLAPKYSGPYRIKRKTGLNTYELESDKHKSIGVWHVKDLKQDFTRMVD